MSLFEDDCACSKIPTPELNKREKLVKNTIKSIETVNASFGKDEMKDIVSHKHQNDTNITNSIQNNSDLKFLSPNCTNDMKPSVMFTFMQDDFTSQMVSCQTGNLHKPDHTTLDAMKNATADKLNIEKKNVDIQTFAVKLEDTSYQEKIKNVLGKKMASSCGPDYNLNKITSYNRFECHYLGVGEDEKGRKVRNPFQTWKGTLPSCDDDVRISDELEQEIREVAYDAASGDEAKLNVDEFMCRIHSIPI
tara:strand:+ start:701 stop:1447 length:747 start_codon:yes stop_codon:yes gene_type:complete